MRVIYKTGARRRFVKMTAPNPNESLYTVYFFLFFALLCFFGKGEPDRRVEQDYWRVKPEFGGGLQTKKKSKIGS